MAKYFKFTPEQVDNIDNTRVEYMLALAIEDEKLRLEYERKSLRW